MFSLKRLGRRPGELQRLKRDGWDGHRCLPTVKLHPHGGRVWGIVHDNDGHDRVLRVGLPVEKGHGLNATGHVVSLCLAAPRTGLHEAAKVGHGVVPVVLCGRSRHEYVNI